MSGQSPELPVCPMKRLAMVHLIYPNPLDCTTAPGVHAGYIPETEAYCLIKEYNHAEICKVHPYIAYHIINKINYRLLVYGISSQKKNN
jgi:hypothetical protein